LPSVAGVAGAVRRVFSFAAVSAGLGSVVTGDTAPIISVALAEGILATGRGAPGEGERLRAPGFASGVLTTAATLGAAADFAPAFGAGAASGDDPTLAGGGETILGDEATRAGCGDATLGDEPTFGDT
jgi:hypothetical protein